MINGQIPSYLPPKEIAQLNTLAHYLSAEDICLDAEVPSKPALIDAISRHMERTHSLPRETVFHGLSRREQLGSTGLGQGVAIPHARVHDLDRILAAYMRLKLPIPFDAMDGQAVSDILVLLVPKQAADEHLSVLAEATRLFSDRRFRVCLHQAGTAMEVRQLFDSWRQPA